MADEKLLSAFIRVNPRLVSGQQMPMPDVPGNTVDENPKAQGRKDTIQYRWALRLCVFALSFQSSFSCRGAAPRRKKKPLSA